MFPRSLPSLPPHVIDNSNGHVSANERSQSEIFNEENSHGQDAVDARPLPKRKIRQNIKKSQRERKRENTKSESVKYNRPDADSTIVSFKNASQLLSNRSEEKSEEASTQNEASNAPKNINMSILDRIKNKRHAVKDRRNKSGGEITFTAPSVSEETLLVLNPSLLKGNTVSQPVGKIYVEEERGFREVDGVFLATNYDQSLNVDAAVPTAGVDLAVNLAVRTQKFFHTFSTWCHGLLAGMALWQCIAVYQLGPPHFEALDFINHYSVLSQPVQTLFYFFFVICTVSAFDRYDVGNPQWSNCKYILSCRTGVIIILIYPTSLMLSLSIANLDDKLSLHSYNSSLWIENDIEDVDEDLNYWKMMNLGRCIGAVLGWIIIALQPHINSFLHRLERVEHFSTNKTTEVDTTG